MKRSELIVYLQRVIDENGDGEVLWGCADEAMIELITQKDVVSSMDNNGNYVTIIDSSGADEWWLDDMYTPMIPNTKA